MKVAIPARVTPMAAQEGPLIRGVAVLQGAVAMAACRRWRGAAHVTLQARATVAQVALRATAALLHSHPKAPRLRRLRKFLMTPGGRRQYRLPLLRSLSTSDCPTGPLCPSGCGSASESISGTPRQLRWPPMTQRAAHTAFTSRRRRRARTHAKQSQPRLQQRRRRYQGHRRRGGKA
jgi:hypothetical protein